MNIKSIIVSSIFSFSCVWISTVNVKKISFNWSAFLYNLVYRSFLFTRFEQYNTTYSALLIRFLGQVLLFFKPFDIKRVMKQLISTCVSFEILFSFI